MIDQISPRSIELSTNQRSISDAFDNCKEKFCKECKFPTCMIPVVPAVCIPMKIKEILTCTYCAIEELELKDFVNAFCLVNLDKNCHHDTRLTEFQDKNFEYLLSDGDLVENLVNVSWTTG